VSTDCDEPPFITLLRERYPEVDALVLADILSLASEKGKISYDDIELREDLKEDLLLDLEKDRILIPYNTSKTMAWEDRLLVFKPGELYEMPLVIRHLIRIARDKGVWDPSLAMESSLVEIGESEPEKIRVLFEKVLTGIEINVITPEDFMKNAVDLDNKVCLVIAELKSAGIISPCLRRPYKLRYEVNPSLINEIQA
jgi:hypothetical protein